MDTTHSMTRQVAVPWRYAGIGALIGAGAAIVMAMFAMIAAATYQGTGFFTPLYHIASSVLDPSAMMRSMQAAGSGDTFTFSAGPAVVGFALHMLTGAFWGAIFGLIVATGRLRGFVGLLAGIVYGLLVMVVMALIGLPIVAAIFGGGDPISDMPKLAGWGTFTIEHAIYGAVLGLWPLLRGSSQVATRRSTQPAAA
ncbi:MAG TPA: hypothetical protein VGL16_12660 [Actinomycetota bacterium]